jgi:peptide/nickel transport system permease protein
LLITTAWLLARRVLVALPILLLVSFLLFAALRLLPVDAAAMSLPPTATIAEIAEKRHAMGLDQPIPAQYVIWLGDALSGRFGISTALRRDAGTLVAAALPATVELAVCAMAIATVVGLGGGLLLFRVRGGWMEAVGDLGSTLMMSVPDFMWALLLLLVFGVLVPVLPFMGRLDPGLSLPRGSGFLLVDAALTLRGAVLLSALRHMALPALALGLAFAPPIMRVLRSSLLGVYHDDYIRQARLRGIGEGRILLHHALKNAILPTLTLMGVQFGFLFGGTLLIEVIYGYPGIGNLMVDAVRNADLPVIQAVGLSYCVVVLVISMAVDGLALVLDPRARAR